MENTSTSSARTPYWDALDLPINTRKDTLQAVGIEAVDRLLLTPTADEQEATAKTITRALGVERGDAIEARTLALMVEAARLGVLIGYALAKTPARTSCEDWLQRALQTAGLADYTPPRPN